jgi:hypothetical protein
MEVALSKNLLKHSNNVLRTVIRQSAGRVTFTVTINKSRSWTFEYAAVYLDARVFLTENYVVTLRAKNSNWYKSFIKYNESSTNIKLLQYIVHPENYHD